MKTYTHATRFTIIIKFRMRKKNYEYFGLNRDTLVLQGYRACTLSLVAPYPIQFVPILFVFFFSLFLLFLPEQGCTPNNITAYQHKIIEFIYGFCHTFSILFIHTHSLAVVYSVLSLSIQPLLEMLFCVQCTYTAFSGVVCQCMYSTTLHA